MKKNTIRQMMTPLVGVHFYLLFVISFGAEIAIKIGCALL
jgi:hypothetical protein